jgi:hypothetical protein
MSWCQHDEGAARGPASGGAPTTTVAFQRLPARLGGNGTRIPLKGIEAGAPLPGRRQRRQPPALPDDAMSSPSALHTGETVRQADHPPCTLQRTFSLKSCFDASAGDRPHDYLHLIGIRVVRQLPACTWYLKDHCRQQDATMGVTNASTRIPLRSQSVPRWHPACEYLADRQFTAAIPSPTRSDRAFEPRQESPYAGTCPRIRKISRVLHQ